MTNNFAVGAALIGTITNIVDAAGNPAKFQSPPVWSTSDTSILTLVTAPDGLSATGTAAKTGSVVVTVVGDGVSETVSLDIVAGAVISFQIGFAVAPAAAPTGS